MESVRVSDAPIEVTQKGCQFLWSIQIHLVPRARNEVQLGVGKKLRKFPGSPLVCLVFLSAEDQYGAGDAPNCAPEIKLCHGMT